MSRVLVTTAPGVDPARVGAALEALGAGSVRLPAPELPGVFVVEVYADGLHDFLARAAAVPGVVSAEPDQWRYTQPDAPLPEPPAPPIGGPGLDGPGPTLGIEDPSVIPE